MSTDLYQCWVDNVGWAKYDKKYIIRECEQDPALVGQSIIRLTYGEDIPIDELEKQGTMLKKWR